MLTGTTPFPPTAESHAWSRPGTGTMNCPATSRLMVVQLTAADNAKVVSLRGKSVSWARAQGRGSHGGKCF